MKKTLFSLVVVLILLLGFMGCTDSPKLTLLSPPSEMHGIWEKKSGETVMSSLEITSNNIIMKNRPDFSEPYDVFNFAETEGMTIIDYKVSPTVYQILMHNGPVTDEPFNTGIYILTLKSSTTIEVFVAENGSSGIEKDYIKK